MATQIRIQLDPTMDHCTICCADKGMGHYSPGCDEATAVYAPFAHTVITTADNVRNVRNVRQVHHEGDTTMANVPVTAQTLYEWMMTLEDMRQALKADVDTEAPMLLADLTEARNSLAQEALCRDPDTGVSPGAEAFIEMLEKEEQAAGR